MRQIGYIMKKHGLTDELIKDIPMAITLKNWLIKHGVDDLMASIDDIANHGCEGGANGFIYTSDLMEFMRQDGVLVTIRGMIEDCAEAFGDSMFSVASGIVKNKHLPKFQVEHYAAMTMVAPVDEILKDDYLLAQIIWWAVRHTAYQMADVKIDIDSATDEGSETE